MAKQTSAQDSNSKENTFKPNWNPFCLMKSDWLSLPAKLVGTGLDSILSHVRTRSQKLIYWFSNQATLAHNEKSLKMSLPSSTSLVAAWARCSENRLHLIFANIFLGVSHFGSESLVLVHKLCAEMRYPFPNQMHQKNTNSKYAKTVSYQVYPCQNLGVIWKKWVSAVGKVYNILIAYLDEHQGFSKISNTGEKRGLRMVLKTSGLIPQWCIDRRMAGFRHQIQDLRSKCDRQIPADLTPTVRFYCFSEI